MADDDVLDRPRAIDPLLPEAVRREMEQLARQREDPAPEPAPADAGARAETPDPAPSPGLEPLEAFPRTADVPYEAHSRLDDRPQHKLALLFRGDGFLLLDYNNFDSAEYLPSPRPGQAPALVLLFRGQRPAEIHLLGTELRPLGPYLRQHRIAWLREHPSGTVRGGRTQTVITRILVKPLKQEP
jgi:hypothetical protein